MPSAPASSSASSSVDDGFLESQEARDARAADKNAAFKDAQAEAKVRLLDCHSWCAPCSIYIRSCVVPICVPMHANTFLIDRWLFDICFCQAAEKAARAAEDRAKEAKKEFKQAKGEACATRPGGKL